MTSTTVAPGVRKRIVNGRTAYVAAIQLPREPGRRYARQVSKSFPTLRAAKEWRRGVLTQKDQGAYVPPSRLTVDAWLDTWLEGRRRLRPASVAATKNNLRPARSAWGTRTLQSITKGDVEALMTAMREHGTPPRNKPVSAVTANLALRVVKQAFGAAVESGVLQRNPAVGVERYEEARSRAAVWDEDQMRAFLGRVAEDPWVGGWHLSAHGLRIGEVCGLAWEQVDFHEDGTVTIAVIQNRVVVGGGEPVLGSVKSRMSERSLLMGPKVAAALRATRAAQAEARLAGGSTYEPSGFVVTDRAGRAEHPAVYRRAFLRHAEAAGLPRITLHELRHSVVGIMLRAGVRPELVARYLGHRPQMSLSTYWRQTTAETAEASEVLASALYG